MIQTKMDFSMYINRFFTYLVTSIILVGCSGYEIDYDTDWSVPEDIIIGQPTKLDNKDTFNMYGSFDNNEIHQNIAVLLPLSGNNAQIGKSIRASVEMAVLERNSDNVSVSFYDTVPDIHNTITNVLMTSPDAIIGPLFANDAKALRNAKPASLPVLSFTSDANAIGDGVMTMALMPTNSVEEIVKQMKSDDAKKFIIIAPDNKSGHLMAGTAKAAAEIYEMPLIGIFFYTEKDSESIKNAASSASMYNARTMAHTRARQIISDILTSENLTPIEKSNLNTQLTKLEKTETVGNVPYDAILFLGNGDDTKALASFLRYYNIGSRDAAFYGTTMWDGSDIASDYTLSGAKYATLPDTDTRFSATYETIMGTKPNHLSGFGYDATNLVMNMLSSNKTNAEYLLSPSGYIGTDGLFKIKQNGNNERALRIMKLNGTGTPTEIRRSATNFLTPMYSIEQQDITPADAMDMETDGLNPNDYIRLPERLRNKYHSKTIGANVKKQHKIQPENIVTIESDETTISTPEYQSAKPDSVKRTYIEEYEIEE